MFFLSSHAVIKGHAGPRARRTLAPFNLPTPLQKVLRFRGKGKLSTQNKQKTPLPMPHFSDSGMFGCAGKCKKQL